MITILPAIKSAIQGISLLAATSDCYLTPGENYIPPGLGRPCIGIRPAGLIRREIGISTWEYLATVELIGAVTLGVNSASALTGTSGVLALLDAATTILAGNRLSLSKVQAALVGDDSGATLYRDEHGRWLVKMTRSINYTMEIIG